MSPCPFLLLFLALLLPFPARAGDASPPPAEKVIDEAALFPPLFSDIPDELHHVASPITRERLYKPDGKGGLYFEDEILHAQESYPGVTDTYVESEQPKLRVYFIVHRPAVSNRDVDWKTETTAARLLGRYLGHFALDVLPQGGADKPPAEERSAYTDEEFPTSYLPIYPVVISYEIGETPGGAFSVNFRSWSYGGGAHDNWSYESLSLMRANGREIEIHEIFPTDASLEKAAEYFATQGILAFTGEERDISLNIEPGDIVMERLILVPEGLDVLFDPYEKVSFADGDIRLRIPLADFQDLSMNPALWLPPAKTTQPPALPGQ